MRAQIIIDKLPLWFVLVLGLAILLAGCNLPGVQAPLLPTSTLAPPTILPVTQAAPTLTLTTAPTTASTQSQPTLQPTAVPTIQPSPSLPAPSPTAPPQTSPTEYAVVLVQEDDMLNIRTAPGPQNSQAGRLAHNATGIRLTGREEQVGDQRWVEIIPPGGGTGWVNAYFLTEWVTDEAFCADPRVNALVIELKNALVNKDGDKFAQLVSLRHGLNLQYLRGGTVASYTPQEAGWLFDSTYQTNWGAHPGSGLDVKGSFSSEVLPRLVEVFTADYTQNCEMLSVGGTTYVAAWPPEYANLHFFSIYKPGSPQTELDWRTWLVGVEYVSGKPTLVVLNHLQWEP